MSLRILLSSEFVRIAFQRFPEALACALAGTLIGCGLIANVIDADPLSLRMIYLCMAGFLWFLGLRFAVEGHGLNLQKGRLAALIGFLAFSFFIVVLKPLASDMITFLSGLVLLLLVSPFLRQPRNNEAFWNFAHDLGRGLFFALLMSGLFCLGVFLIELSLNELFGIEFHSTFMEYVFTITHGFVAPAYFLARAPHGTPVGEARLPKDVRIISSYVCVPFVWAYLLILYAYMAKIGMLMKLPGGQLGWLITLFGIAGIMTHLVAYPLRENGNFLARSYYRWFYPALLAPIALLALALYSRIEPYGLTESRYLMVLVCLWFSIVAVYFTFMRRHGNLRLVPLSLAVLMLGVSFTPWGISDLPTRSQFVRFTTLLEKNDLLKDGKLQKTTREISKEDRVAITSTLEYLSSSRMTTGHNKLRALMGETEIPEEISEYKDTYSTRDKFYEITGTKAYYGYENHESPKYLSISRPDGETIDIAGYEAYFSFDIYNFEKAHFTFDGMKCTLSRLLVNDVLHIQCGEKGADRLELPLGESINKLLAKHFKTFETEKSEVAASEMRFPLSGQTLEAVVQLNRFSGAAKWENEAFTIPEPSISGSLLLRRKR